MKSIFHHVLEHFTSTDADIVCDDINWWKLTWIDLFDSKRYCFTRIYKWIIGFNQNLCLNQVVVDLSEFSQRIRGDKMCHTNCVSRDNQSFYQKAKYIHQNNALLIKIKVYFRESIKNMIFINRYYFAFLETLLVLWNKIFLIKRCAFRSSTKIYKTYFRHSKKKCILYAKTKKLPAKMNSLCKNCTFLSKQHYFRNTEDFIQNP